MLLGCLIDAGADEDYIKNGLSSLNVSGYQINVLQGKSKGIAARQINITVEEEQPHRHLADIIEIIDTSSLSIKVKGLAKQVFDLIARAEAKVHGTTIDHVHFHEVGSLDSICDIVGTLLAVENLGVERIVCSPLPMGYGYVQCDHGEIPVPAPATLEILKGIPVRRMEVEGELVTPTGAALVVSLAEEFSSFPTMIVETTGYGMGTRNFHFPNVVRAVIGKDDLANHTRVHIQEHQHNHEHNEHKHEHKHEQDHKHDNEHIHKLQTQTSA